MNSLMLGAIAMTYSIIALFFPASGNKPETGSSCSSLHPSG